MHSFLPPEERCSRALLEQTEKNRITWDSALNRKALMPLQQGKHKKLCRIWGRREMQHNSMNNLATTFFYPTKTFLLLFDTVILTCLSASMQKISLAHISVAARLNQTHQFSLPLCRERWNKYARCRLKIEARFLNFGGNPIPNTISFPNAWHCLVPRL